MLSDSATRQRRLVTEVSRDPQFLGYALACYQQRHRVDDATLARLLRTDTGHLDDVRLCARPWPDPYQLRLGRIAEVFDLDMPAFARIITAGEQPVQEQVGAGELLPATPLRWARAQ